MTRPIVIVHSLVSVDGRTAGFPADVGQYYDAAAALDADCMLTGSDTILKAMEAEGVGPDGDFPAGPPAAEPADERPLLVVSDSRGRVNTWQALRAAGYWRGVTALVSQSTPAEYLAYLERGHVPYVRAGANRVDLRAALEELGRRGIRKVRTDSGGTLNGVLLRQGLVDEVSVLVQPALAGAGGHGSVFRFDGDGADEAVPELQIISSRRLKNGIVWLRYRVVR